MNATLLQAINIMWMGMVGIFVVIGTVQMQELEQLIGQALSELPEKTRIIYKMSRDQEMTYEEIAQEIDLSVKSVEYHMTKTLAHMRHKLKDYLILLCFGLIPLLT